MTPLRSTLEYVGTEHISWYKDQIMSQEVFLLKFETAILPER